MALARNAVTVGGFTLLSRVTGLARDVLTAALLGAGPMADAFFVAFRLPNLFRRLLGEGVFQPAFVPLYERHLQAGGPARAQRFGEDVLSVLLPVLLALVLAAEAAMPQVVGVLAPGLAASPDTLDAAVLFARITFPTWPACRWRRCWRRCSMRAAASMPPPPCPWCSMRC